ncbi:hypothetical protein [Streptomyces sp. 4F14]|uniref:hypothetical protein n=1 Tax=Streptomyces sp. 4F14 TaxID=3394380 RepID=UPI003A887126
MKSANKITLLDVTLRDGGYVNSHSWTVGQAQGVVRACEAAGVPFTEVGYLRPSRHGDDTAPSASCSPRYLEALQSEAETGTGLVVMAHAKDTSPSDLAGLARFGVRLVRMPVAPYSVQELAPYAAAAQDAGMRFSVNLIRISELSEQDILSAALEAEKISADVFYLADSNGSMFPDGVSGITRHVRDTVSIKLGFHAHDGLSLGFANALAAMDNGFEYIDASLCGMGKGGGNLALELISAHLRFRQLCDVSVTPLVDSAVSLLTPWKGDQILSRCESIVSGILDLNLENLAEIRSAGSSSTLFSMLDSAAAPC